MILKIARPDSLQNFMDTAKTIDLTCLCIICIQINNTVVFFQSYIHQTYKEFPNKKHVNSKPKVLSNTMFHIGMFRTTDINCRTERLGIKIVLPNKLSIFLKHFDIYMYID